MMTIEQFLVIEDRLKPKTMRKWISRSKEQFQDIPVKVYIKTKDTDLLYCNNCGAMPEKVIGTTDPNDAMSCLTCFKHENSANEFFA